jgi:hypothetical protein
MSISRYHEELLDSLIEGTLPRTNVNPLGTFKRRVVQRSTSSSYGHGTNPADAGRSQSGLRKFLKGAAERHHRLSSDDLVYGDNNYENRSAKKAISKSIDRHQRKVMKRK